MQFKTNIEICEMPNEDVAGRTKIRMTALKIHDDINEHNDNGITWIEKYIKNNIKSLIGASYKVSFIDDEKTIPSGHGTMDYDENGNVIFEDSDTVGSIQNAYIDTVELNGVSTKALVTEGYLYNQSYPNFIEWLRDETNSGTIYGSIEINGKGKSKSIVYANGGTNDDGTPKIGRQPKIFDFTALAILSDFVPPADSSSQVLELNSKEGNTMKQIKSKQTVELNELSYDDIATLVTRAFNTVMNPKNGYDDYCYRYWIYKFYPTSNRVILYSDYEVPYKYFMTTYEISNNNIVLGEITEVEQDWKPINNEIEVEINAALIKDILSKSNKEVKQMDEKVILELNQKIENKTTEINELTNKNTELVTANTELNQTVVGANKALEEANTKIDSLTAELNSCKEELSTLKAEKEKAELEAKQAEVNYYYENEIPKNGFAEEEVNSLKSYVDNADLEGLKSAESELCTKKFKEMLSKETKNEAEINSSKVSFITIHEKDKKVVADNSVIFFN